jgi:hypothetical protein
MRMSEYFWLTLDDQKMKPIFPVLHPEGPELRPDMSQLEIASIRYGVVGYFNDEDGVITDILTQPAFLVSDGLKRLLTAYQRQAAFRAVQLYDIHQDSVNNPLYWIGIYPALPCLSAQSEFYPNGLVKRLVLDRARIPRRAFFQPADLLERRLIVRLDLAESIARRPFTGVKLVEVEVAD